MPGRINHKIAGVLAVLVAPAAREHLKVMVLRVTKTAVRSLTHDIYIGRGTGCGFLAGGLG